MGRRYKEAVDGKESNNTQKEIKAKEILTCGFHRIPQNQLCSRTYTLFGTDF